MSIKEKIFELLERGITSSAEISEKLNVSRRYVRQVKSEYYKKLKLEDIVSKKTEVPFQVLPSYQFERIGVIADIHVPFHQEDVLYFVLDYLERQGLDCLVIAGDFVDFYSLSPFMRNPNMRDLASELKIAKNILADISKLFKDTEIFYIKSNHEQRLERFLANKAPEFYNLDFFRLDMFLNLPSYNITLFDTPIIFEFGKTSLVVMHGHEYKSRAEINVARQMFLKTGCNVLFGHWHFTQEYYHRTIDNKVYGSWLIGCLCSLSPDWRRFTNWNWGFAIVEKVKDGFFKVHNKIVLRRENKLVIV